MVEVVARLVKEGSLEFTKEVPLTLTYHDPCHLGRQGEPYVPWDGAENKIFGQAVVYDPPKPRYNGAKGVYDAPRDVLRAFREWNWWRWSATAKRPGAAEREAACGRPIPNSTRGPRANVWTRPAVPAPKPS